MVKGSMFCLLGYVEAPLFLVFGKCIVSMSVVDKFRWTVLL